MTTVNLIAAIGRRGQVGLRGGTPWPRKQDMLYLEIFEPATRGGVVVMGRRTHEQLATNHGAAKPLLPGRAVYPFGRTNTPEGLIKLIELEHPGWPIWIAGGPAAWAAFAPHITGLRLISVIDYDGEADSWFPFDAFGMEIPG
jgi:dihydromethanopterin reductase